MTKVFISYRQKDSESLKRLIGIIRKFDADVNETPVQSRLWWRPDSWLSLMVNAEILDALIGDLQQRHDLIASTEGTLKADFWYWNQLLRSLGPFAWAWLKRIAVGPFGRIG